MAVTTAFLNAAAAGGVAAVTHIALLDDGGVELTGGGYARQSVSWGAPSAGAIHPASDLVFDVPAGATVAGWAGYTASTGGTSHGGDDLDPETYTNAGTYTLTAASTGYDLN